MMEPGVIRFAFDPLLTVGDVTTRLQTVFLALIILAALLAVARIGRVTPTAGPYVPAPTLSPSDLPFLILGIVPGAVVGGRLDYILVHLDFYAANPASILNPGQGALGLGLAVPGAILGGVVIARLVDAPLDRWLHAAVLPTLFLLAAGKFSGLLSAEGQGAPSNLPWATAYLGDGPWASLSAWIPSHPSQVYEAALMTMILIVFGLVLRAGAFSRRDGSALLVAVSLWAIARFLTAFTWRDDPVLGPIRAEQWIMVAVFGGCFLGISWLRGRARTERRLRTEFQR